MKQLIILIGLKGSGKTYIGSLIQERLGINFVRVEDIWLTIKRKRFSEEYYSEGFRLVEQEIENQFKSSDLLTIESTGTSKYFKPFLREQLNREALEVDFEFDAVIENENSSDDEILMKINEMVK